MERTLPRKSPRFLFSLLVSIFTFLAYHRIFHAAFIWDDDAYVTENMALRTVHGLWDIWTKPGAVPQYYPLTFSVFWMQFQMWGANPLGYHVVNLLFHTGNALLLAFILLDLGIPGAWLASLIFALHPVHVESVAWVSELKNVLSTFLSLLSIRYYLRFIQERSKVPAENGHAGLLSRNYKISLILYVGALLSKTITCIEPVTLMIILWWKGKPVRGRDVSPLIPFFILGALFASITIWMERHVVGAVGVYWNLTRLQRALIAGHAVWFYADKLLWPARLLFMYPRWDVNPALGSSILYPLAALGILIGLWIFRNRIGKGPLAAILLFLLNLAPALGFANVYPMRYAYVADHYQYCASIGLNVLFSAAVAVFFKRLNARPAFWVGMVALFGLNLALAVNRETRKYENSITLWSDTLMKNPSSSIAYNNLGAIALNQKDWKGALFNFKMALLYNPDAESNYNYANVLAQSGHFGEAIRYFRESIRLGPQTPEMHNDLANCLLHEGKKREAIAEYRKALALAPKAEWIQKNLENALKTAGNLKRWRVGEDRL